MKQKWDFMEQVTGQLKCVVSSYEAFCDIAIQMEELDTQVWHDDYGDRDPFAHFNVVEFPQDYIAIQNIADAYVRAVLSDKVYYKEYYTFMYTARWKGCDKNFWSIPQEERKKYLMECRALYEGVAVIENARFIMRDWEALINATGYYEEGVDRFAAILKTSAALAQELARFKNAKIFEIKGCENGFWVYVALKRNCLLLVTCGCWQ